MGKLSKEELINYFNIPSTEELSNDKSCLYKKGIHPIPGRIYIFSHYVCFYSKNVVLNNEKLTLSISKIIKIKKTKSFGLISNAIKLYLSDEKAYYFKNIKNRDSFYDEIRKLWKE